MVENLKIKLVIFMSISIFFITGAQIKDSTICNDYFNWLELEEPQLMTLWSKAPSQKETNTSLLSELCDLIVNDSCNSFMTATLIIDRKGNPMCVRVYPENTFDSLSNITELLYKLEFNPALANGDSVVSHYGLIINSYKCETYEILNEQENKFLGDTSRNI